MGDGRMKVLVTGGGGFLGSHVADALSDAGHQAVVFDRRPSPWLRPDQTMIVGDVLDRDALAAAAAGCGAVYHLAAVADIGVALDSPCATIETNIIGTLNALEAARRAAVERVVFASSIYVYSRQGGFYRTSKQAGELLVQDYRERYGLSYTILRFGSLYGPRADAGNAIHKMLTQALTRRRIEYGGTGEEVREYIHVRDAAEMSVDILAAEHADQIVHLTGRDRMTTGEMLRMAAEMVGGAEIVLGGAPIPGHYLHTPYTFTPKLGRKMTPRSYIDLGLGLLDCLEHIHRAATGPDAEPAGGLAVAASGTDANGADAKGSGAQGSGAGENGR